jgi:TrmH family RNA methyltransferase
MSPVRAPTGIVAVARRRASNLAAIAATPAALIVVAVDVQDPGNIGSLVRAAEAGGATGMLVCGQSANPFGWKALRGSMGSALRLPLVGGPSVDDAVAMLRRHEVRLLAAVPRGGVDPDDLDWSGACAVLLGGEGPGLPPEILGSADARTTIPMAVEVESLNVAVAGALLVYAARRQRNR